MSRYYFQPNYPIKQTMFPFHRFVIAILLTVLLSSVGRSQDKEPDFVTTVLPQETLALIRVANWGSLNDQAGEFPMGRIYNTDLMKAFRAEVEKKGSDYLVETFGIDLAKVNKTVSGQFVAAMVADSNQAISVLTLLETSDSETAARLANLTVDKVQSRGIPESSKRTGLPPEAVRLELTFREGDILSGGPLIVCPVDRYVVLARSVEIFQTITKRWNDRAKSGGLLQSDVYQATRSLLAREEPHLFNWYVDPIALMVIDDELAYSKTAASKEASIARIPFPRRHGFAGLQAIAGAGWQDADTKMMRFDIQVYAPSPLEEAMKMFEFDSGEMRFPSLIQDDIKVATIVRWKLSEILKNIGGLFDDITDAPGAFDATMMDLKRFLNVDVPGELMPALGPEIAIMSVDIEDLDLDANVVAIEIKNPVVNERMVAKMIYQLLSGDTEARRSRLPGKSYELWQIKLKVGGNGSFSSLGMMVADGRLWLSTHAAAIRRVVLQSKSSPLGDSPLNQAFQKTIESRLTKDTIGMSLSQMNLDSKQAYETLRKLGPKGLESIESIYSTLLQLILDEENSVINFDTLPPFDDVRKDLHNLAIIADQTDAGWRIQGVVFEDGE